MTDAQAELVEMMLHDGCNPTEAAKRMGRNKSWAYNTLNKQHVIEYRQKSGYDGVGMGCHTGDGDYENVVAGQEQLCEAGGGEGSVR